MAGLPTLPTLPSIFLLLNMLQFNVGYAYLQESIVQRYLGCVAPRNVTMEPAHKSLAQHILVNVFQDIRVS